MSDLMSGWWSSRTHAGVGHRPVNFGDPANQLGILSPELYPRISVSFAGVRLHALVMCEKGDGGIKLKSLRPLLRVPFYDESPKSMLLAKRWRIKCTVDHDFRDLAVILLHLHLGYTLLATIGPVKNLVAVNLV